MPIAPSNNHPSVTKNPGSLSTALGVGRSLSAGRGSGGDGGDGLRRNLNLSPGGSSLDTAFAIGNDQTATSRRPNHAGLLEEGLTLSPSAIAGGFAGTYSNLVGTPFNFDWDATFEPLAAATAVAAAAAAVVATPGSIYEPQNELLNDPQQRQLSQRQDLNIPPPPAQVQAPPALVPPALVPPPSNSTTGSNNNNKNNNSSTTTPILASEQHNQITGGTSTNQTSPLVRTATKRKAEQPEPAQAVQNWAVPAAPREESRKRSQTGSGHAANAVQNSRKWSSRPSPTGAGGSGSGGGGGGGGGGNSISITEIHTGNGVNHTRNNSSAAFGNANVNSSNTAGPSPSSSSSAGGLAASNPTVRRTASEGDEATKSGRTSGIMRTTRAQSFPEIPKILPHEKVFPVQIGSELFRLSGASISSDEQSEDGNGAGVRTLYIDRDPVTFKDISLHLQVPRLISQLFESEIFIQIGNRHFQIPRDIFSSPGDSPNFFSLGFAVFFSSPSEVFPGLNREGLLRPPSILPPSVPNRSADVFAELLHMLRGYPLRIRDEEHRAALLRDCRYFHLRGLEQKLIPHHISFNFKRSRSEIVIRLEDIRQSGVSFLGDSSPADRSPSSGWVNYARPFVDETSYELILEVTGESTKIDFRSMRAEFIGQARARISSLFQVIANKMNLPVNQPLGLMMMSSGGAANHP
ncbi:hypothetical protein GP486_007962, partial [Trichoglossum hirsutum]